MQTIQPVQSQDFFGKKLSGQIADYNGKVDAHNNEVAAIQAEEQALKSLAVDAPVEELGTIPARRAELGRRRTAAVVSAIRLLADREPMQGPVFEAYAQERGKRLAAYESAKARIVKLFDDNALDTHFLPGVVSGSCKAEAAAASAMANPPSIFNREMQELIAQLRQQI
jgi:hypothetical protein